MTAPPNYRTVNCDFCCGGKPFTHVLHCPWAKVSSPATPMRQIVKAAFVEGFCAGVVNPGQGSESAWQESQAVRDSVARSAEGATAPATPLHKAIQKLADQFSRWGKSKTNTNDSLTEAWSFVAEQLKKALADAARLPASQEIDETATEEYAQKHRIPR